MMVSNLNEFNIQNQTELYKTQYDNFLYFYTAAEKSGNSMSVIEICMLLDVCFVDLKKATVSQEYGVSGPLLDAVLLELTDSWVTSSKFVLRTS